MGDDGDYRLLDAIPVGIQVLEAAGDAPGELTLVWANAEAGRQTGFDLASLAGRRVCDIFPGESPWLGIVFAACLEQRSRTVELPYADERVGEGWWRAQVRPLGGRRVLAAYENLTEQRGRERALRASERLNRTIVESLEDGILVVEPDGRIAQVNPAAARLCRLPVAEVVGRHFAELPIEILGPEGQPMAPEALPHRRAVAGERVRGARAQVVQRDGTRLWVEVDSIPLAEEGGEPPYGALSTYRDVTAHVERERRIRHEADHDALTGVANRRALERALGAALSRAAERERGVVVLLLDLDGFKAVNDRWGHQAGDEILRQVAGRLRGVVRERDVVARPGGDEFVVVLTDVGRTSGAGEAWRERVSGALARPFALDGAEVSLHAAIGLAAYPVDGPDAAALLAHADRSMYARKAARRRG